MKWITLVLCAALTVMSIGCNQATESTSSPRPTTASSPTPDELASARANFQKHCQACHGETGEGGLVTVEGKRLKVPSFKAPHALKDPDEDFIEQINKGGEGMPSFKDKLKPEEMTDLVKLIRKQFQGK
ncbi:MAG TPA: cytochrome c [Pyrinomonadaceae bacterium]